MNAWWKSFAATAAVVLMSVASPSSARADGLEIGDEAPALDIMEWVQGEAVDLAAAKGKNVVVVEFWATWCGPCKQTIPHLGEVQAKYADKGLRIIGVSTEKPEEVRKFVADKTPEFKYTVAVDNLQNTSAAYMQAVGAQGIPHAFIIDKSGALAWHGHPTQMDAVLEKVVAGTFDMAKAKSTAEKRKEMFRQLPTRDPDLIGPAADAVLATDPGNEEATNIRVQIWRMKDDSAGYRKWCADLVAKLQADAEGLNGFAWRLATETDVSWRDPSLALSAAKKAVELTQGKQAANLDTLARVYSELGLIDRAVEQQKLAISMLDAKTSDDMKKQYAEVLGYYESCAALAKSEKPAAPAKADPKSTPKKK
ncbi:MAG: TlpA family protein disulfide reductase [Planctomycetes bacterium]|nr:TlpA family protein disulfide reductase [Planctomycetota bacterium]